MTSQAKENKLSVTLDFDYMSKWMTKGKEGYSENGAFFETLNLDFWDTGLRGYRSNTSVRPAPASIPGMT